MPHPFALSLGERVGWHKLNWYEFMRSETWAEARSRRLSFFCKVGARFRSVQILDRLLRQTLIAVRVRDCNVVANPSQAQGVSLGISTG